MLDCQRHIDQVYERFSGINATNCGGREGPKRIGDVRRPAYTSIVDYGNTDKGNKPTVQPPIDSSSQ